MQEVARRLQRNEKSTRHVPTLSHVFPLKRSSRIFGSAPIWRADIAAQMRDKLDKGMFERWRDIQIAASMDSIRNPKLEIDAKRDVLKKLQSTYPDYAIIGLVSPEGLVIATSNRMAEGSDVSKREYFIYGRQAHLTAPVGVR